MPSLAQARRPLPEGYKRVAPEGASGQIHASLEPIFNTFLRCPLPPVSITPDSLRQYYRGSLIPQNRLMTPSNLSTTGGGTVTNNVSGGSSSVINNKNKTVTTDVGKAQNASVTSSQLDMGEQFFGIATMSKTFDLLQIAVSSAARVRLYATAVEQTLDAGRPDTTAPLIGTTQGIISDITLDTPPLEWLMTWIPTGANGDFPRTSNIYITIDNVAAVSTTITATLLYVNNEQTNVP